MAISHVLLAIAAAVGFILALVFIVLYIIKKPDCPNCPACNSCCTGCPACNSCCTGATGCHACNSCCTGMTGGLSGIDFPTNYQGQTINSNGVYGLFAVDDNDDNLTANTEDNNQIPWPDNP